MFKRLVSFGDIPISEIDVGDEVLAYNEATGVTDSYTVVATIQHTDPVIVLLTIDGETLETTADHPFYTADGEWVEAADLKAGDDIRTLDGNAGQVETVFFLERTQPMYNLTVDEAHTFFVGDGQWLVHNQGKCDLSKAKSKIEKVVDEHPADSGRCEVCADETSRAIKDAYPQYDVEIVQIENNYPAPAIPVKGGNGKYFAISVDGRHKQPFHQTVRIRIGQEEWAMDALVYDHQGVKAMPFDDYMNLFQFPEDVGVTKVIVVP